MLKQMVGMMIGKGESGCVQPDGETGESETRRDKGTDVETGESETRPDKGTGGETGESETRRDKGTGGETWESETRRDKETDGETGESEARRDKETGGEEIYYAREIVGNIGIELMKRRRIEAEREFIF